MQLVKDGVVIDFLGKRFYAGILSVSYTQLTLTTSDLV